MIVNSQFGLFYNIFKKYLYINVNHFMNNDKSQTDQQIGHVDILLIPGNKL